MLGADEQPAGPLIGPVADCLEEALFATTGEGWLKSLQTASPPTAIGADTWLVGDGTRSTQLCEDFFQRDSRGPFADAFCGGRTPGAIDRENALVLDEGMIDGPTEGEAAPAVRPDFSSVRSAGLRCIDPEHSPICARCDGCASDAVDSAVGHLHSSELSLYCRCSPPPSLDLEVAYELTGEKAGLPPSECC